MGEKQKKGVRYIINFYFVIVCTFTELPFSTFSNLYFSNHSNPERLTYFPFCVVFLKGIFFRLLLVSKMFKCRHCC